MDKLEVSKVLNLKNRLCEFHRSVSGLFRQKARQLLEKQIKEGEVLLEEFEQPEKTTGQITVGIGWYQWSDHEPEEEGG